MRPQRVPDQTLFHRARRSYVIEQGAGQIRQRRRHVFGERRSPLVCPQADGNIEPVQLRGQQTQVAWQLDDDTGNGNVISVNHPNKGNTGSQG